jgi:hypothetical protein
MAKTWEEYLSENGLNRPLEDLERYITGITNRIMLMQPEEVESWRHKLTELRILIDRKLG